MELRQLRHFLALAAERNFTRAAAREHIVQSGLSNSIQALERELDVELYVRSSRPVRLTAAGEALVAHAQKTLEAANTARDTVQAFHNVLTGQLRVGVIHAAQHLVPFATHIASFVAAHPGVDVHLVQKPALEMLHDIAKGQLDCAYLTVVPGAPTSGLRLTRLGAEPLLLLIRSDDPLATNDELVLADLEGQRFVEVHHGWSLRAMSDAAFTAAGITRQVTCEVDDWSLMAELVAAGLGVAFFPQGLAESLLRQHSQTLRLRPVRDLNLERRIELALPAETATSAAARRFTEYVQQHRHAGGRAAPR